MNYIASKRLFTNLVAFTVPFLIAILYGSTFLGQLARNVGSVVSNHSLSLISSEQVQAEIQQSILNATKWLQLSAHLMPDQPYVWQRYGEFSVLVSHADGSVQTIWDNIANEVTNPKVTSSEYILWGHHYRHLHNKTAAFHAYQLASQLNPENREAWYWLGQWYEDDKAWDLAIATYEQGTIKDEGDIGASTLIYQIGRIKLYEMSPPDLNGAWQAFESVLIIDDYTPGSIIKISTYYNRCFILTLGKLWSDAATECKQALELNPEHFWSNVTYANVLWELGRQTEAWNAIQKAAEIDPTSKYTYRAMGVFFMAEGSNNSARIMFEKVLEIDPLDKIAQDSLNSLNKGSVTE